MHVFQLLIQIATILFAGRVLGRLFRKVGQPSVVAEIVAGILLGPSLLGMISPGALHALFPASSLAALSVTAQLGLVFFMFLVGLEFDVGLLRGQGRASLAISVAGILVPFVLGGLLAFPLEPLLGVAGVPPLTLALFMGIAMSVTAFPVLARILAERHLLRTRIGALALASAAANDVVAWCLLAVVVAVASASGVGSAATTIALTVPYVMVMWMVVRPALARLGPRAGSVVSADLVSAVFLLLLLSAAATEWIGIHALFGAFLFGAVVPRESGLAERLIEKLEDLVTLVMLPLFFAYSGLRTEISLLNSVEGWQTAGVVVLVATVGKFGGTALAARLAGLELRGAAAIGILMNTRGLMELVVLNVGLDLGVVSPELFTMMVVMALVTTLATSPILELIYPAAAMLRAEADAALATASERPGLLLCISDPAIAGPMAHFAAAWSHKDQSPVWALHLAPLDRMSDSLVQPLEAPVLPDSEALTELSAQAEALGVVLHPVMLESAAPAQDIVRFAGDKQAQLVLLGGHRSPRMNAETLGGTAGEVLKDAPGDVGVLIARSATPILRVARHGSDAAVNRVISRLAAGGRVTVVEGLGEPVDLVVAPAASWRALPESGGPSWILVAGRA